MGIPFHVFQDLKSFTKLFHDGVLIIWKPVNQGYLLMLNLVVVLLLPRVLILVVLLNPLSSLCNVVFFDKIECLNL